MQSSEERVFISLDLESPNLNAKLPNNTSWLNLQEIKNNFIERNLNKLILSFNNQIPWNEKLNLENIYKFLICDTNNAERWSLHMSSIGCAM